MPNRIVQLPGQGEFEVPTHVSRVDSWKLSAQGRLQRAWHGWQVRWPGFRKFFSDRKHGGCARALAASSRFVKRHYPGRKSQCDPSVGVRVVERRKPTRQVVEVYVEVSHPKRGKAAKRLYVGTAATVTQKRLKQQVAEGWRLRRELIEAHRAETGTIE